jgi:hypothetical protein
MLRTAPSPEPPPPARPYRRSRGPFIALMVLLAVGVAAAVFLVFAGNNDAPPEAATGPSTPSTAPPATTVDPEAATKAEIETAYREAFNAFVAVGSDLNGQPNDPRLAEGTKGAALAAAQLSIRKWRADGHVLKVHQLDMNPRVVELGPNTAVVEDCGIDVSALLDGRTGEVVEPAGPPEAELNVATFELVNGVWMQDTFANAQGPCEPAES